MTSNVSFTVRPPPQTFETDTPEPSRPGSASPSDLDSLPPATKPKGKRQWESYTADSSDEDEEDTKEMITGFDAMGVRRSDGKSNKPAGPLVIPSQKNRDWHAVSMARKRQQMYVPEGAKVGTGADGSVGGLGTRGKINDGPQLSGLVVTKREEVDGDVKMEEVTEVEVEIEQEVKKEEPMDEDQRALQALLRGEQGEEKRREIAAITVQDAPGAWAQPKTEADAFKEDLATRPEESSLADYDRVPIELFGEAMLRGMGMGKPTKKMIQPYIPEARPALLGIGAKPRPADEVDQGKGKKFARPDKRYIPILKVEKNGSGQSSRRTSRSRSGSPSRESSRRDRELDRRDRDRRDKDYDRRDRDYDRDKRRDRDYDRDKRRDYDSDRDRDRRRDYDDDRGSRRRDYDDDRDRRRDDSRDRRRDRDRDDRRDRDKDRRR